MSTYFETEARLQEALNYKREHPNSSFRWLERQFNVPKDRIQRRFKGTRTSKSVRKPTNLKLDSHQDKALCWYLTELWKMGVPLRYKGINTAANEILATAHPTTDPTIPPPTVGINWAQRWLQRHPEFSRRLEKPIEAERQRAMNKERISDFFDKFKKICDTHGIQKEDIWNMDETGLRVGVGRGQWVIVPTDQTMDSRFKNIIGSLGDTEHISIVEAISAGGTTIAPLIIIKGVIIQARWFRDLREGDIAIGVTDSG
jgi:Tc5 transposase DNA-binding domain